MLRHQILRNSIILIEFESDYMKCVHAMSSHDQPAALQPVIITSIVCMQCITPY